MHVVYVATSLLKETWLKLKGTLAWNQIVADEKFEIYEVKLNYYPREQHGFWNRGDVDKNLSGNEISDPFPDNICVDMCATFVAVY